MGQVTSYQQFFDMVIRHTIDILFIVDQNRHILFSTPNLNEITGYSPEELRQMDISDIVHAEDKKHKLQRYETLLLSQQNASTAYRIINKYGEVRFLECKTTILPDTTNHLQVVSARDITDRKRMEKELERHQNRYEVLQNSLKNFSSDLSSIMNPTELENRLVKELKVILPGAEPELLVYHLDDRSEEQGLDPSFIQIETGSMKKIREKLWMKIGEFQGSIYLLSVETRALHGKMESIWMETLVYFVVMFFKNITLIDELTKELETALNEEETPEWILQLLFRLQERQRVALASDLHDTVLQDQIDLYRRLESLLSKKEMEAESKVRLKEVEQGMLDTIYDIRKMCNELLPPMLKELGLRRALENLFEQVQLKSTFRIILISGENSDLSLSEEETVGIYRMVQELLQNAEKHAAASVLQFTIHCENAVWKMVYKDDGVGMETEKLDSSLSSMALTSLVKRAESMGGKIEFQSDSESGLKVVFELPVNKRRSVSYG